MAKRSQPSFESNVEQIIGRLRQAMEGDPTKALDTASGAVNYRVRRGAASEARLSKHLGEEHPRVVDLRARLQHLEAIDQGLQLERKRIEDEPMLRPGEWLVTGRVRDESGAPLVGYQVLVFDDDRGPDDPLGDELTDKSGAFRAEYHRRDFSDEKDDVVPQLMVAVFDSHRKLLFTTDRPVPASSTRRDRFEIVLTKQRLADGVHRASCTATTASGSACKNLARPGSSLCSIHGRTTDQAGSDGTAS